MSARRSSAAVRVLVAMLLGLSALAAPALSATAPAPGTKADEAGAAEAGLLGLLERARRENRNRALRTLLDDAEGRPLLDAAVPYVSLGEDAGLCYRAVDAPCFLWLAAAAAERVADRQRRDWAFGEIAIAQAQAGLAGLARRTLRRIDDARFVLRTASVVSATRDGRESDADPANGGGPASRSLAQLREVTAASADGRFEEALGRLEAARGAVADIDSPYAADFARSRIAHAAADLMERSGTPSAEVVLAYAGEVGAAHLRALACWHAALAFRRTGQEAAASWADHLGDNALREVRSALRRVWTLATLAEMRAAARERGQAREALEDAVAVARGIRTSFARARAFTRLAAAVTTIRSHPGSMAGD